MIPRDFCSIQGYTKERTLQLDFSKKNEYLQHLHTKNTHEL